MSLFSGLKDILGQINRIDGSIYRHGKNFADIYAKNIALEEEIAERTKELEQANRNLITLKSVWNMMNSSEPLSSMFENIIRILHDDMKYTYISIFKTETDADNNKFLKIESCSKNDILDELYKLTDASVETYKLPYEENSIIYKSLTDKKVYYTSDIKGFIKMFFPALTEERLKEIISKIKSKTFCIIPLYTNSEDFGCIMVTTEREIINDTEMNFLSLYANQVELAITITGLFDEVRKQAVTDPLTGIFNRRYFEDNIEKEVERSLRLNQPFSLVSLDLDYLKKINDTYGHQFGDLAIKTIAGILKKEARSIDIPARIGGEEFNLLLPGVDSKGAFIAVERIRKSIENQKLDTIGGVTASIGVATFLEHSDNVDELIELADQAMYKAKIEGRNRVKIAKPLSEIEWQKVAVDTFLDILAKKRIPVDQKISEDIYNKLQNIHIEDKDSHDIIYSISDIISQSYNQMYKEGTTKSKLMLAVMLANKIQLSEEDTDKLRLAILLYDIGNIMIPGNILNKKEPLTEEEKNIIKQHPIIAAREILKPISNVQDIIPIIEAHHESWDGEGYPSNKSGADIPVVSQIVLLVDSFFAMSQERPYRQAYTSDEILDIIKSESGKRWNKNLVDDFIYVVKHENF